MFIGGNLVSWKSKKQSVVSQSNTEFEYRAMTQSMCEIIWLYQLLMEVDIKTPIPTKLWCDNQTALNIAYNPVFHEQTNHIEIDCHFGHEKIQPDLIFTRHVKTEKQLSNIFTKALVGTELVIYVTNCA